MASAHPVQFEAEPFGEVEEVGKANVLDMARAETFKESFGVNHAARVTPGAEAIGTLPRYSQSTSALVRPPASSA